MNVKKTIASIAAIAMVASATSLAPLFTGTSIAADELTDADVAAAADGEVDGDVTETETETEAAENNDIPADEDGETEPVPVEAPSNGLTFTEGANAATVDTNTITGTASTNVVNDEKDDILSVNVTLTPTAGDIGGQPQNGSDNTKKNYHITIPINGLSSEWKLVTTDGGEYDYDDGTHEEWNVANNKLMLWLPAKSGTCKVVLKKGADADAVYQVIEVTTTVAAAPAASTVTAPTEATVRPDTVKNGTASATVATAGGVTTVTVAITPEDGKTIGGDPQQGGTAPTTPQNYHITIPITGLTTEWIFESGYDFDEAGHHEFNITEDTLMLWLPVTEKTHTIVLKKGAAADAETFTIKVTTEIATTTPPEEEEPPIEEDPTDAEKVDAVKTELGPDINAAKDSWNFEGKTHGEAEAIVRDWFASQGYEFAGNVEIVFDWQEENGGVWISFNITYGDEHEYGLGAWKNYTAPVIGGEVVTPDPAPAPVISYYPPVVSNNPVNPSAGTVKEVSSASQIAASKQKEVTVNAKETDVTPAMVNAFIKNKNAKTLTLKYSASLKISIDKSSITSASADLNFSVSGKNFLSAKTISKSKALKNAEKIVQLDFVNKGDLDGVDKAAIKSRVGVEFMGKTVTVYEYKNGKLVKVAKAKVNGAGIVKFNTDHLGQFVLAVE